MTKLQFSNIQQEGKGLLFSKNSSSILPTEEEDIKERIKSDVKSRDLSGQVKYGTLLKRIKKPNGKPSVTDLSIIATASSPSVRKRKGKGMTFGSVEEVEEFDPVEIFTIIDEINDDEEPYLNGGGLFKRDIGTLPPPVRTLLEQIKDEKITSVQAWRYPLMKGLQDIVKKVIKLPYDSIFHLGLNLNGKYNLEKDIILKFTKAGQKSDKPENKSKVVNVTKDITFGQLFDGLQKKMGDKLTEYDARTNNCQDFSLAILSVLGIDDAELKKFIKQDAEQIYKSFGIWGKLVEGLSSLNTLKGQVVDRLKYGEGSDEIQPHNNYLPLVQISFK